MELRGNFRGWVVLPAQSPSTHVGPRVSRSAHVLNPLSAADVMDDLYNYVNPHNGKHSPMISKETLDIVLANKDVRNWFVLIFPFHF